MSIIEELTGGQKPEKVFFAGTADNTLLFTTGNYFLNYATGTVSVNASSQTSFPEYELVQSDFDVDGNSIISESFMTSFQITANIDNGVYDGVFTSSAYLITEPFSNTITDTSSLVTSLISTTTTDGNARPGSGSGTRGFVGIFSGSQINQVPHYGLLYIREALSWSAVNTGDIYRTWEWE